MPDGQGTLKAPTPASHPANPNGRFAGRVVVVTGGASGIGCATVEAFAREGAKVAFCARSTDRGAEVEAVVRAFGGEAAFTAADVRDDAAIRALAPRPSKT